MQSLRVLTNTILSNLTLPKCITIIPACGLKYFAPPQNFDDIIMPDKPKLRFYEKVPVYPQNIRPPKMQKRLRYMRGPEEIHNFLLHKQYGIIATGGGRMRIEHFEMVRLNTGRHMDYRRMFALWRIDPPWQPVTKKGQGMRMGGGKGAIDHYVTPVKAGRVIMELGGKCEFKEVQQFLKVVADRLPFKAEVVSHEGMLAQAAKEKRLEAENINPYTMKYVIQNNMGGCHRWLSPVDHFWYNKHR